MGRAETAFYEAFNRLKANKPDHLSKGTPVSQNNVAREAGCDPSALKKARYPELVDEIQKWTVANPVAPQVSPRQAVLAQRKKNRSLRERIDEVIVQRDMAVSLLVEADAKILELATENARLRSLLPPSNVSTMRPKPPKEAT